MAKHMNNRQDPFLPCQLPPLNVQYRPFPASSNSFLWSLGSFRLLLGGILFPRYWFPVYIRWLMPVSGTSGNVLKRILCLLLVSLSPHESLLAPKLNWAEVGSLFWFLFTFFLRTDSFYMKMCAILDLLGLWGSITYFSLFLGHFLYCLRFHRR